ncbi:hypothetical protein CMI47_11995 [Candidatus Pacearchaeota archaeon]|nr:hypothetical protein [Candidatus Pacearchaeota archaeon]|tara:strand:+ start:10218 stop:10424 length:207 start_codon:yes stop_codon:yes gene_type:complete
MTIGIEAIIWYLVLIDAIFANLTFLFWRKWWKKTKFSKIIPMNGWWVLIYIVLVGWAGSALYRLGILF